MKIRPKKPAVKKPLTAADIRAGEVFRFTGDYTSKALYLRTCAPYDEVGAIISIADGFQAHIEFSGGMAVELVQGAFVEDGADE
jgi:hypothetical protein